MDASQNFGGAEPGRECVRARIGEHASHFALERHWIRELARRSEAQQAFVKHHFRSVTNESFNDANTEFAKIEMPFTVELFGGWDRAYPDVIQGVFIDQIKTK